MPTNATISAVVGYLTLLATSAVELFNWHLSGQQQHALVAIIGAAAGLSAIIYGGLVHHTAAKVVVAKLTADAAKTSNVGVTTFSTTAVPSDPRVVEAIRQGLATRKRPSRAKPKTPPAV